MSYCRFSDDSDVYFYLSVNGGYYCCACWFDDDGPYATALDSIAHLERHIEAGHRVPPSALEAIAR